MSIERIEKAERRIKTVEDAVILLTALTDSHNDQLENFLFGLDELKANQKNSDDKINMLIDAQITTEDKLQRFEAEMKVFREESEKANKSLREELRTIAKDLAESIKTVNQRVERIERKN